MSALAPRRRDAWVLGVLAGGLALVTVAATKVLGPIGLALPLGVALVLASLVRPRVLAAALLVVVVVFEVESGTLIGGSGVLYAPVAKSLSPFELGLGVVAIGLILERHAAQTAIVLPSPFTVPLLIIAVATILGIYVGHTNGAGLHGEIPSARILFVLIGLPFVMVNLLDTHQRQRQALTLACALGIFKAVVGLAGLVTGHGAASLEGTQITYYEPAANFLMLLVVLYAFGSLLRGQRAPRWVNVGSLICFAALLLSFRRSFWIGGVAALALVLVIGSGPTLRRLLVPMLLVFAGAVYLALSGSAVTESQSPVVQRATSLQTSKVTANAEDRYRLDERHNVIAVVRQHPITGLGLDVPWQAIYPLSIEHPGGRLYTHVVILWYWLKLGLLGVIGYLSLCAAAVVAGLRLFRRHTDPWMRSAGLAVATGVVGLMLAEATASFTGVDIRLTIVEGTALGFVAAGLSVAGPESDNTKEVTA